MGKDLTCFIALLLEHHSEKNTDYLIENHLKKLSEIEEIRFAC